MGVRPIIFAPKWSPDTPGTNQSSEILKKIKGGKGEQNQNGTQKNRNFDCDSKIWGQKFFILKKFLLRNVQHFILSWIVPKSFKSD